jgi:hypothetical protein
MLRLLLALIPALLLSACASPDRKVIATRYTTLHQQTIFAEYTIPVAGNPR